MFLPRLCKLIFPIFLLFFTAAIEAEDYRISDALSRVNGREVKAREFTTDISMYAPKYRTTTPDLLTIKIDASGFIRLKTKVMSGSYLFAAGEVERFVAILRKSSDDAKYARFSKQAGLFRVGAVSGQLIISLSTSAGGNFNYISLLSKGPDGPGYSGRWIEHRMTQEEVSGLIEVISNKDKVIASLSGETDSIDVVKLSMSKPGSLGADGGLTLKIEKRNKITLLTVDELDFRLTIGEGNIKEFLSGLDKSLNYLHLANSTYDDLPSKKFKLGFVGGRNVFGLIKSFSGSGDRYMFTTRLVGDSEVEPRFVVIDERQLRHMVESLR